MKKIHLLCCLILVGATASNAQPTEGSINYSITLEGVDAQTASMMQGATMTMSFKGKQSRMDMDMGMIKSSMLIKDDKTYSLMDYMGKKFKIPLSKDEVKSKKMKDSDYDIEYTNETKQIAGYTCKKALIKTKDKNVYAFWYTEAVFPTAYEHTQYAKFKGGCPLEYEISQNGMKMKMTATKVVLGNIADSVFIIPDDYQEVTMEQLMQMMGGGKSKN